MKKAKKILGLGLAAVLTAGVVLAGCGNGDSAAQDVEGTTQETTMEQEDKGTEAEDISNTENGGPDASEAGGTDKTKLKLAYLVDTLDESQHFVSENMELYCGYLEETEGLEIEYNVFDAKMSLTEQMSQIENCVSMGYDGVVINPVDPDGILPTAQQAMADGLVMLDLRSSNDAYNLQLDYADEYARGELMKQWFLDYMDAHPDEVFYVGLIQGAPTTPQTMPRCSVLATIAEERPDNFVVLDEQYCPNWTTEDAMKIVEDWLQVYPEMNAIFSAAEQLAYGAAQVLEQAGVADDFVQITVNGEAMGIEMMRKGQLIMDCGTFTPATGGGAIRLLVDGIRNGTKGRYDYSEYTIFLMTPENVDDIEKRYETFEWSEMGEAKKVY